MRILKPIALVWVFLVSALLWAAPPSAHAGEDVLRLLIWDGYAPEKYVEEFEQRIEAKYGRRVRLDVSAVEGPEDFYVAVRGKRADLVTLTHHYFKDERFNYIANLLLPIRPENVPNAKQVITALQQADYLSSGGQTYGVPVCQGPYGLAYSTEKIERAPDSWRILWDPEYKARYVLGGNEYLYNVSMAALAWGYPREKISSFAVLNNVDFRGKLRQLATNAHSFWSGQDTAADLSGRTLAAVWGDSLGTLRRRGESWELAEPREGTLAWIDNYAITWTLADQPFLRKVAEEWINRLLEPDYQVDYIVREIALGPVTTNIVALLTDEEKLRLHANSPRFFQDNRMLLPTFSRRDRNGLKLLWEEAMKGIPWQQGAE